jgi:D-alanine-D-alanine ligase
MRIGLTYDLAQDYLDAGFSPDDVAEFDSPAVLEAIEGAIEALGHAPRRIGHAGALLAALSRGERWDLVFNIAEGLSTTGRSREAQVPTLLELYAIPYTFSDPLVCALTLDKAMTKRIIRDLGLPTPRFAVVRSLADARAIDLPLPLFAKPVAEGSSKGVTGASWIRTRGDIAPVCDLLLQRFAQPVLVETYLPGRELTVGIVGTGEHATPIAAMEIHLNERAEQGIYSFDNKEHWQDRMTFSLATGALRDEAFDLALRAFLGLGCRDAARVDVRQDAQGRLNFLEINPLPGLHPVKSDLPILSRMAGMQYRQLLSRIIHSASERISQAPAKLPPGLSHSFAERKPSTPRHAPA